MHRASVGEDDGDDDGNCVGDVDGAIDGDALGDADGNRVGLPLGANVEHAPKVVTSDATQLALGFLQTLDPSQSESKQHPASKVHVPGHTPPQSTSVSWSSFTPFLHNEIVGDMLGDAVGLTDGSMVGAHVFRIVSSKKSHGSFTQPNSTGGLGAAAQGSSINFPSPPKMATGCHERHVPSGWQYDMTAAPTMPETSLPPVPHTSPHFLPRHASSVGLGSHMFSFGAGMVKLFGSSTIVPAEHTPVPVALADSAIASSAAVRAREFLTLLYRTGSLVPEIAT